MTAKTRLLGIICTTAVGAAFLAGLPEAANAQGVPPIPAVYSGAVSAPIPVPDGLFIHARIADYQSAPVVVKDERYQALTVAPPNSTYFDKTVTFHLDGVQAGETDSCGGTGGQTSEYLQLQACQQCEGWEDTEELLYSLGL